MSTISLIEHWVKSNVGSVIKAGEGLARGEAKTLATIASGLSNLGVTSLLGDILTSSRKARDELESYLDERFPPEIVRLLVGAVSVCTGIVAVAEAVGATVASVQIGLTLIAIVFLVIGIKALKPLVLQKVAEVRERLQQAIEM